MSIWLTLQEYSNQKGLSISTLRRKIKNGQIEYIKKEGRYLLRSVEREFSANSLRQHYQDLLDKKNRYIKKLEADREDMLHLLSFLEEEKASLLERIVPQSPPSSKGQL